MKFRLKHFSAIVAFTLSCVQFSTCYAATEYVVSAKVSSDGHEMQVFLNNKQICFKDNTPENNCNDGDFSWKEYEALNTQEIKSGNKIISLNKKSSGIKEYIDGQFDVKKVGGKIVVIAKSPGQAVLELQYLGTEESRYCNIKYSIPFIVTK